jgi:hypothetical protein
MSFADFTPRANAAQLRTFGSPVALPGGREVVGVFVRTPTPKTPWPEIGAALSLRHTPNPEVHLLTADAAGLMRNASITITTDGATEDFLVVDTDPPADGMVRVALLAAPATATRPDPANRWQ